jgi:hypothetical protein
MVIHDRNRLMGRLLLYLCIGVESELEPASWERAEIDLLAYQPMAGNQSA